MQYLPWEFSTIPRKWVEYLRQADEVWVPSTFIREVFVESGLRAEQVQVVPHGINPQFFQCHQEVLSQSSPRQGVRKVEFVREHTGQQIEEGTFLLLYHGGLLYRKGIDKLLEAYRGAFSAREPVALLVHSVYGDPAAQELVLEYEKQLQRGVALPQLIHMKASLSEQELLELYSLVDALVHSARAEGFGLGVIEAMAAGLPVLLPRYGGPLDFATDATAFLFDTKPQGCRLFPCLPTAHHIFSPDWETTGELQWADYDPKALGKRMRQLYTNPAEGARVAARARRHVCDNWSWRKAFLRMRERLQALHPRLPPLRS